MREALSQKRLPSVGEVFALTLPQLGLMLCHLAISMTDLWVAGQLDSAVLASLGFVGQIVMFLMLVTAMVASGCMATVSQSLGAGRPLRAKRYAGLVLLLSLGAGGAIGLAGMLCVQLGLHGPFAPAPVVPVVTVFGTAYALQLPFLYTMIMLNSVFRAYKLVWLPFATLVLVALSNFAGSVGLGLGCWGLPAWGYAAVAWTTFASNLLGFGCNLWLATRRGIICRRAFAPRRWCRVAAVRLWRIGAPQALVNLAEQTGSMAILACVGSLPGQALAAVAGMTLGMRLMGLVSFPLAALGMSVTIFSGHLLGAGAVDAARALGRRLALGVAGVMLAVVACLLLARGPLLALFVDDAQTGALASAFVLCAASALPVQAAGSMLGAVLAGAGATRFTARIGCCCTWLVAVPLAWGMGHGLGLGAHGVYAGMAAGSWCSGLWLVWVFAQGRWLACVPGLRGRLAGSR